MDAYLLSQDVTLTQNPGRTVRVYLSGGYILVTEREVFVEGVVLRWLTDINPRVEDGGNLLLTPSGYKLSDAMVPVGYGSDLAEIFSQLRLDPRDFVVLHGCVVPTHNLQPGARPELRETRQGVSEESEEDLLGCRAPGGHFFFPWTFYENGDRYGATAYLTQGGPEYFGGGEDMGRWNHGPLQYTLHRLRVGYLITEMAPGLGWYKHLSANLPNNLLITRQPFPGIKRLNFDVCNMDQVVDFVMLNKKP